MTQKTHYLHPKKLNQHTEHSMLIVHVGWLTIANDRKQKCPLNYLLIKKMLFIHRVEYYSTTAKNKQAVTYASLDGTGGNY